MDWTAVSRSRAICLALALLLGCVGCRRTQAQVPAELASAPCAQAPRIDGQQSLGEWDSASHVSVALPMARQGRAADSRQAEFWAMNSTRTLYIAFRVPDAERQASLSPVLADLVALVFARGEHLAPGDDRRLMIPGMYADKHVTEPGKDADDGRKDGAGAMGYDAGQHTYCIEFAVPLDSGDPEDLAAKPGDSVRFNLVYADGFSADFAKTEVGGLYGGNADDATGWGSLVLAANVTEEKPAPDPAWAERLFPHTGAPDEFAHRLRRTEAEEIPLAEGRAGQVTVEFLYRGVDGKPLTGHGRVYLPPAVLDDPAATVPLLYAAGYELDPGGATGGLAKGMAVVTPHAEPLNPIVRGPNLDVALLHAARALPCIDNGRVVIQGGSAGGYMTLMLTAETFPLVCAMPDVPPVHWGYNAAYFVRNRDLARAKAEGQELTAMPVLTAVLTLAEQGLEVVGPDPSAEGWLLESPLWQLVTITAPVQVTFSTADMLVPIDQVSPTLVKARAEGLFPPEFTSAMDDCLPRPETRRTLLETLPADSYEVFTIPAPADAVKVTPTPQEGVKWQTLELPFSETRQWSIEIIDEGGQEPDVGHFRFALGVNREPFLRWAMGRGLTPEQLTLPKLTRLMMRLTGEEYLPAQVQPKGAEQPFTATRLDFPAAERADVLSGLRAFARDDACALRLAEVYAQLPEHLRTLGATLGDGSAQSVRVALAAE